MTTPQRSDQTADTLRYYKDHAGVFIANTISLDMRDVYLPFLAGIPERGRILDAGCGSGRDSLAFLGMGYDVVSIDGSPSMVEATSRLTGRAALKMAFDEVVFEGEFDGVWACASLLHVSRTELAGTISRLGRALRPSGILYFSFKYGDAERIDGGRFFNDINESLLPRFVSLNGELELNRVWITEDVRPERRNDRWLNAIARKRARDVR